MKKLVSALFLIIWLSGSLFAQSQKISSPVEPSIAFVVNTASWCPACQKNGERVEKEVLSSYQNNSKVKVIVNDLSNKETKARSSEDLNAMGLLNVAKENKGTGQILIVDLTSKKVLGTVAVSEPTESIVSKLNTSLK